MIDQHLQSSLTLLKNTFPNGIPESEYFTLLNLFYEDFSDRNLATLIGHFQNKHYTEAMNDIYKSQSTDKPKADSVKKLKEKLKLHGYNQWKRED